MLRSIFLVAAAGVLLSSTLVFAQSGGHGAHGDGTSAAAPHRGVQAAMDEMDRVIGTGLGAGLAFAADQNGFPGPLHVLELADRLRLTAEQTRRMEALQTAMLAASRPASRLLLDAEARLRRLFADGVADEARVRSAVAEVERARTEVRLVHLLTHLQVRPELTDEQRRLYQQARWGQ